MKRFISITGSTTRESAVYGIRVFIIALGLSDCNITIFLSDEVRAGLVKVMGVLQWPGKSKDNNSWCNESIEKSILNGVLIRLDDVI